MSRVKLYVDTRENEILNKLEIEEREVTQLENGDFLIKVDEEPFIVIERKSTKDLAQSVKDGRYKEQKLRLLSLKRNNPKLKIMYIIEGFFSFDNNFNVQNIKGDVLQGCVINSMIRDNVFIIFTRNVEDTCNCVKAIFKRVSSDPIKYTSDLDMSASIDRSSYTDSLIKTKKKDNIDKNACLLGQLAMIPGISTKKAQNIIEHMNINSINGLCKMFDGTDNDVKTLTKVPGIGKQLAIAILSYMCDTKDYN